MESEEKIMIDRGVLKERGKQAMHLQYWKCMLVALILSLVCGGGGGGSSSGSSSSNKESFTELEEMITQSAGSGEGVKNSINPEVLAGLGIALGAVAVILIIVFLIAIVFVVFVSNPIEVGARSFYLQNSRKRMPGFGELGKGFSGGCYGNVVTTMFMRNLYIFLWSLLFIIPGVVKKYEYMMIPYLLAEHPEMSREEAFYKSREMMNGHKWEAFVLHLSFIGWWLLSILTCGILALFFVNPYYHCTMAELYRELSCDVYDPQANSFQTKEFVADSEVF